MTEISSAAEMVPSVEGRVRGSGRSAIAGLIVEVVDCAIGGDVVLATTHTDERGAFQVDLPDLTARDRAAPDLQVRVREPHEDAAPLGESAVVYDATSVTTTLDVELAGPAGLTSEYGELARALGPLTTGRQGDLEESTTRRDISRAARKAGWDARVVAMATQADRLAAGTNDTVPAPLFYALMRAGVPGSPEALFRASPTTVSTVWRQSVAAGLVAPELADTLDDSVQAFEQAAADVALQTRAGGVSSLDQLLDLTFPGDEARKRDVALLQVRADDSATLWASVEDAFGTDVAAALRRTGELGDLTLDNAPLVDTVLRTEETSSRGPLGSVTDLARRAYHRPERWLSLLEESAVDAVPTPFDTGQPDEDRRQYAEFLAARVRASSPTAVLATRIADGEVALRHGADLAEDVVAFLDEHAGAFEIGVEPVDHYLAGPGRSAPDDRVLDEVRRVQRTYQVSPDDQSLSALLEQGHDSASAIAALPFDEFARAHEATIDPATARVVHARATQISDIVANLATSYLTARTAPAVGRRDGNALLEPYTESDPSGTLAYPTLEGLFGSLNVEACEDCGSILSPAAYLADLLHYLDRPKLLDKNPLDALLRRRPDIGHLPLSCENTNTVVPHIDLVNEMLEYFVRTISLDGYTGHTTPEGQTSAEALARPSYVDDTAYAALNTRDALHPAPLPYHRHLAEVRALLATLGAPLDEVLRVLRRDPSNGVETAYGWREINHERAGIAPMQAVALLDATVPLSALLGFPTGTPDDTVRAELGTVRSWATRLGLTYDEVDRVLATRFVNPSVALRPWLEQLGVSFADVARVKSGGLTAADFRALVPGDLDLALFGGDVVAWVTEPARFEKIMDLVVAVPPRTAEGTPVPGSQFDDFDIRHAGDDRPRLTAQDVRRAAHFVRLWRTTGWSIETVDEVLAALMDGSDENPLDDALARLGGLRAVMRRLTLTEDDLPSLLACWADVGTTGPTSLYHRLFPAGGVANAAFQPDAVGAVLVSDPPKVDTARESLRAALGLSPDDFEALLGWLDITAQTTVDLSLVSRLYRHAWLARQLGQRPMDLLHLLELADLDPFDDIGGDEPGLHRLLDLLDALRDLSCSPQRLVELLRPPAIEDATTAGALGPLVARTVRGLTRAAGAPLHVDTTTSAQRLNELLALQFGATVGSLVAALRDLPAETTNVESLLGGHPELMPWQAPLQAGLGDPEAMAAVYDQMLEPLRSARTRESAVAGVAQCTGAPARLVEALLGDPAVITTTLAGGDRTGLAAVVAAAAAGLTAPAQGAGTYAGLVDLPEPGSYAFGVRLTAGQSATLSVGTAPQTSGEHPRTEPITLETGRFVEVTIQVTGPADGPAPTLEWQRAGEGWVDLPREQLYSAPAIDEVVLVLARFTVAQHLADELDLGVLGTHHLAADPRLVLGEKPWLHAAHDPASDLSTVLRELVGYARLALEPGLSADTLALVLETDVANRKARLLEASGWEPASVEAALAHLGGDPLASLASFIRLAAILRLSGRLSMPVAGLVVVADPDPGPVETAAAEDALRARYGDRWTDALKSVQDPLRAQRRDALVTYVLRELRASRPEVDTAERLFEFFLMDVLMEPPMATSRVRNAISAVQLFVERILMNLDAEVRPDVFGDPERWQSLKRYRLWEANRQVFLWPENWLDPALRTDQSPAFRRTMSELLQSDINDDTAAVALLGYLAQLEEVAKLEPAAIFNEEKEPGFSDDVAHVLARTPGAQRRYYYRQRKGSWTAWEQVPLDIEDNPIMPVIWKGRLLLFWLKIVNPETTAPPPAPPGVADVPLADVHVGDLQGPAMAGVMARPRAVLCWSEYYNNRWQPPKTSDVAAPSDFGRPFDLSGDGAFDRSKLRLAVTIEGGVLRVRIEGPTFETSFLFFNTHSLPQRREDQVLETPGPELNGLLARDLDRTTNPETGAVTLHVTYRRLDTASNVERDLLVMTDGSPFRITAPLSRSYARDGAQQGLVHEPWTAPFLYSDSQHAFYVTTIEGRSSDPGLGMSVPRPVVRAIPALTTRDPSPRDAVLGRPTEPLRRLATDRPWVAEEFDFAAGDSQLRAAPRSLRSTDV